MLPTLCAWTLPGELPLLLFILKPTASRPPPAASRAGADELLALLGLDPGDLLLRLSSHLRLLSHRPPAGQQPTPGEPIPG